MIAVAATVFCLLMAGLIVFQAALVAGAPIGQFAWGGQHRVLPRTKRIGSAVSIVLYAAFAVLVLQRAELVALIPGQATVNVGIWVLAGYLVLGIGINGISRSKPERWTMAPLCVVLAALTIFIGLG